jgi:hypothetical protein
VRRAADSPDKRPPKVELDLTPEQRKVWLAECQRRRKLRLPMPSVQEIRRGSDAPKSIWTDWSPIPSRACRWMMATLRDEKAETPRPPPRGLTCARRRERSVAHRQALECDVSGADQQRRGLDLMSRSTF